MIMIISTRHISKHLNSNEKDYNIIAGVNTISDQNIQTAIDLL